MVPDITTVLLLMLLVCYAVSTGKQRVYHGYRSGMLPAARAGKSVRWDRMMSSQHPLLAHKRRLFREKWGLGRSLLLVSILLGIAILVLVACASVPKPEPKLISALPGGSTHTDVNATGAYHTSLPIVVPSYHGLEPQLALTYNSQGGNGWLGVGWHLSGLSSIVRTSPGKGIPNYDLLDVFYLDGNELLPCSSGLHSPSCQYPDPTNPRLLAYTTRIESYQRIARDPVISSGPWYVWNKTGTKLTYEPRSSSSSIPYAWDLTQVEDTLGNTTTYHYRRFETVPPISPLSPEVGASYLDSIMYNGVRVQFYYELRPDVITYAIGTVLVISDYRLKTIDVTVNGVQLRAYKLTYAAKSESRSRSLLTNVQQYGHDVVLDAGSVVGGTALPPTTFTLQTLKNGAVGAWQSQSDQPLTMIPHGSGRQPPSVFAHIKTPLTKLNGVPSHIGDVNGDGRASWMQVRLDENTDTLLFSTAVSLRAEYWSPTGGVFTYNQVVSWPECNCVGGLTTWTADFNGDQKTDFLLMTFTLTPDNTFIPQLSVAFSRGDGQYHLDIRSPQKAPDWAGKDTSIDCRTADINGDGRTDLVCLGNGFIGTAISRGDGSFDFKTTPFQVDNRCSSLAVGDVNGDGLADVVIVEHPSYYQPDCNSGSTLIGLSKGDGTYSWHYSQLEGSQTSFTGYGELFAADIIGNGRADLIWLTASHKTGVFDTLQTAIPVLTDLPSKISYEPHQQSIPSINPAQAEVSFGDFNGDGKIDLLLALPNIGPPRSCPDVITTSYTHAIITRVLANGDGTFNVPRTWYGCQDSREVDMQWDTALWSQRQDSRAADVNGDGLADFLGAYTDSDGHITLVDDVSRPSGLDTFHWQPADVNGDGRTDLVYVSSLYPGVRVSTALQQADGTYKVVTQDVLPDFNNPNSRNWHVMDVLGNGRSELVYVDNYDYVDTAGVRHNGIRVYTLLSLGDGTWNPLAPQDAWPNYSDIDIQNWRPMDVNGDGKIDLVHVTSLLQGHGIEVDTLLANGDGTWVPSPSDLIPPGFYAPDTQNWRPMDVNGDGKMDLIYIANANPGLRIVTLLSQGNGIEWTLKTPDKVLTRVSDLNTQTWEPIDVNGDGIPDLVHLSTPSYAPMGQAIQVDTLFSTGNGSTWVWWPQYVSNSGSERLDWSDLLNWKAADINGDGRMDLVHITNLLQEARIDTLVSTGDGGWAVEPPQKGIKFNFQAPDPRSWMPLDINGGGKADLLHVVADKGQLLANELVSLAPLDLFVSVSNGYGTTTTIDYRSSSAFSINDPNRGCFLPTGVNMQVVSRTTIKDSHTPQLADAQSYSYECAHWSYLHRGFLSWGSVTSSRDATLSRSPSRTVDTYKATDVCLVQQQSTKLLDDSGKLFSGTAYSFISPGSSPPYQCQVASVQQQQYNQQQTAVNDETWYCYDAFGNIERKYEAPDKILLHLANVCGTYAKLGPLSGLGSGMLRTTLRIYLPAVGPYIVGPPAWEGVFPNIISDASQEKPYRSTFYCYDNDNGTATTNCSGMPTHGLLTATREVDDAGQFATTTYKYDSYGNQKDVINPRAYVLPLLPFSTFSSGRFPRVKSIAFGGQTYLVVPGAAGRVWGKTASAQQVLLYAPGIYYATSSNGDWRHTDYDPTYHIYPVKTCAAFNTSLQECTSIAWNVVLGLVMSSTDVNSNTTFSPLYDAFGRVQKTISPNGRVEHRAYYDGEDPKQPSIRSWVEDGSSDGLWTNTYLDGLGRTYHITKKGDAPGVVFAQDTLYADASSLIYRQSHWYTMGTEQPVYEQYQYDGVGRQVKQIHPDGSLLHWAYGNDVTSTWVTSYDELGHARTAFSDAFGRVSQVREENHGQYATTMYSYDGVDELVYVTDAAGNVTEYVYDMLGRRTTALDPDSGIWTYHYYLNGKLLSQTDPKGITLSFTYDALNRLRTKQYPNKAMVVWNYNERGHGESIGRLTSISDPTGAGAGCAGGVSDSLSYDEMGQVTSQTQCVDGKTYTLGFKHDLLGRLSQTTYPGKETVTEIYDPAGRLQSVSGYVDDLKYNAAGQLTKAIYSNKTETDFTYDANRQWLTGETVTSGHTSPLYQANYQYIANGLIQSSTSSTNKMNERYTYDDLNQLLTVSGDRQQRFAYDATGNMKANSQLGTYIYPAPEDPSVCLTKYHRYCIDYPQTVQHAGTQTFTYDPGGNLLTMSDNSTHRSEQFAWNDDNLLASITDAKGTTTMTYDASGERVAKQHGNDKTYYFSSLLEYSSRRGLIKYYYAGSLLVAQGDATGTYWYHQDRLGSTRLMTNKQGDVVVRYDYTAFGQSIQESGSRQNDIRYTGQRMDTVSGLLYLHGRYYDPQIARFISPDPIVSDEQNPQALNAFSYVYNNPISNVDPTGFGTEGEEPGVTLHPEGGEIQIGDTASSSDQSGALGPDVQESPPSTDSPKTQSIPEGCQSRSQCSETILINGPRISYQNSSSFFSQGEITNGYGPRSNQDNRAYERLIQPYFKSGARPTTQWDRLAIALLAAPAAVVAETLGYGIFVTAGKYIVEDAATTPERTSEAAADVQRAMNKFESIPNDVNHVFGQEKHTWNLTGRSQLGNMGLMQRTLLDQYEIIPESGIFKVTDYYGNFEVTVQGNVLNRDIRITTAYVNPSF